MIQLLHCSHALCAPGRSHSGQLLERQWRCHLGIWEVRTLQGDQLFPGGTRVQMAVEELQLLVADLA